MKHLLTLLLALGLALGVEAARPRVQRVYIFGVAASFSDSVAFITPINVLDSAYIGKAGMLTGRTLYSLQLANYLEQLGKPHMTCCVFFATKKPKLDKQYARIVKRYVKDPAVALAMLPDNAFEFKAEAYVPDEE